MLLVCVCVFAEAGARELCRKSLKVGVLPPAQATKQARGQGQDVEQKIQKNDVLKPICAKLLLLSRTSHSVRHRSRGGEWHTVKPQSDVEQVRRQWSSHRQGAAGAAPTIWTADLFMMQMWKFDAPSNQVPLTLLRRTHILTCFRYCHVVILVGGEHSLQAERVDQGPVATCVAMRIMTEGGRLVQVWRLLA